MCFRVCVCVSVSVSVFRANQEQVKGKTTLVIMLMASQKRAKNDSVSMWHTKMQIRWPFGKLILPLQLANIQ